MAGERTARGGRPLAAEDASRRMRRRESMVACDGAAEFELEVEVVYGGLFGWRRPVCRGGMRC